MNIPSLMLSQDLAGLLISLTGQSIIVSLIGIAVIKLLSGQSAPVRSLVCAATIAALGLLMVISIGFRLSDIFQDQIHPPILLEENTSNQTASSELDKASPFLSVDLPPHIQSKFSDEKGMIQSIFSLSLFSIKLTPTGSLIINITGIIWLTGIMFLLVRLGYSIVLSEKFRNNLPGVQDAGFNSMEGNVTGTFWNKPLPKLYSSPLIESPIAIGLFNPIIIIPEKLLATLSGNELKSILLHELSHIHHYDQVIGVIKRFVMAFYWWSPFVYEINRYHEQAREEVSDNYVLRELHPKVYTRCLLDLAEKVSLISSYPTAVGMAGRRFDLKVRVEQLLSKKRRVVMNTRSYLKVITFSISLVLTFMVAGLYASVKVEAIDDAGKELQETRHAINPTPIIEEEQHLSQKNATELEAIEEPTPDNSQKISKSETAIQAKILNKQAQKRGSAIGILASARTNAKEITEKQGEVEEKNIISQKEAIVNNAQAADAYISRGEDPQIIIALSVNDISKPDSASSEQDTDSSEALTERQSDTLEYANRGFKFFRKRQFEKAISNFNKAIELDPGVTLCYFARGQIYLKKKQIDKAISDFNKTIELNPYLINTYIFRGGAYFIGGQIDKAIVDYNKAIEMKPEDADVYHLRGNVYYIKGEIEKAIADYTRAIKINPGLADAYYNRGSAYNFYGNIDMASRDYKKALELNPGYGDTNDEGEIVCRRLRARTGSNLPKRYCATKSQWAAGEIVQEKIPGVTTYTREFPGDSFLPE